VRRLLQGFWDICLLRRGPQDLPASQTLLRLALLVYALAGFTLTLLQETAARAVIAVAADLGLLVLFVQFILYLDGRTGRFVQTLTALAGTGALFALLAWPILAWSASLPLPREAIAFPDLLGLGLMVWNIIVIGHILRHAIDAKLGLGIAIALAYAIVSIKLVELLLIPVS
jgi:hypothetical protein